MAFKAAELYSAGCETVWSGAIYAPGWLGLL